MRQKNQNKIETENAAGHNKERNKRCQTETTKREKHIQVKTTRAYKLQNQDVTRKYRELYDMKLDEEIHTHRKKNNRATLELFQRSVTRHGKNKLWYQ